jgi:signal transduction histidine kinase
MRLMLFELRPLSFEAEGLVGALELRLSAVEKRAGIDTHLDVQGRDFIPPHTELELYRIVTEALNNSLKHANATTISIVIRASEDDIRIQITDNGKGFNTQAVGSGGIGLSSMKERAQRLGGSMNIQSSPNRGTEIAVDILFAGEFVREVSAS